jgi:hypothetical protein
MAEIRGILLNGWMSLLKEKYSPEKIKEARLALGSRDRGLISKTILDSNWYPLDTLYALHGLTKSVAGRQKPVLPVVIGRSMAERAYGGVYRQLPAKDPLKQVGKLSYISEFFFCDTRSLETELDSEGACHIRYCYPVRETDYLAVCLTLLGFWTATIEISGASRVKGAHTRCVGEGAKACELVFTWK